MAQTCNNHLALASQEDLCKETLHTAQVETLPHPPLVRLRRPAVEASPALPVESGNPVFASGSPTKRKAFSLVARLAPALFAIWLVVLALGVIGSGRLPALTYPTSKPPGPQPSQAPKAEAPSQQARAGPGANAVGAPPSSGMPASRSETLNSPHGSAGLAASQPASPGNTSLSGGPGSRGTQPATGANSPRQGRSQQGPTPTAGHPASVPAEPAISHSSASLGH